MSLRSIKYRIAFTLSIVTLLFAVSGCGLGKKVPYFQDIPDSVRTHASITPERFSSPVIKPNDIITITIQTIDPKTAELYSANQVAGPIVSAPANGQANSTGYLVDQSGYIELPITGKIKVGGLTTDQAKEAVKTVALKYYVDPVVNVRFVNFEITLLGEVTRPGKINIANEKVSILDALALGGDIAISGKREDVLLIREVDGVKTFTRFDLTKSDIFKSPNFYLRSGDVVYVTPNKARSRQATVDNTRDKYITYISSLLSVSLSLVLILTRNN